MKPESRAAIVWHLATAHESLVDSGAPEDIQRACLYWLRQALAIPGGADALLEQALEGENVKPLARK